MLVIDPNECIDCALCEPECPVDAIFSEDELPQEQRDFLGLNTEFREDLAQRRTAEGASSGRRGVGRQAEQAPAARTLTRVKTRVNRGT